MCRRIQRNMDWRRSGMSGWQFTRKEFIDCVNVSALACVFAISALREDASESFGVYRIDDRFVVDVQIAQHIRRFASTLGYLMDVDGFQLNIRGFDANRI